MFSFFHRSSTIVVDTFTTNRTVYECAPIMKASKAIPDWFKKLPNYGVGNADSNPGTGATNVKRCYGFTELFKRGLVLPNWQDIHFTLQDQELRWWATGEQPVTHPRSQFTGGFEYTHIVKHVGPWRICEKTGVTFVVIPAEWHMHDVRCKVLPGVLEFTLQQQCNPFLCFTESTEPFDVFLPIGKPLLHLMPLTDKKVVVNNHLITEQEFKKMEFRKQFHIPFKQILNLRDKAREWRKN